MAKETIKNEEIHEMEMALRQQVEKEVQLVQFSYGYQREKNWRARDFQVVALSVSGKIKAHSTSCGNKDGSDSNEIVW